MPYIRNIHGDPREDRRRKLDPSITKIVDALIVLEQTGSIRQCFFDFVRCFFKTTEARASFLQGKVRYYNYCDNGGTALNVILEMERRTKTKVLTFWSAKKFDQAEGGKKAYRHVKLAPLVTEIIGKTDRDRGEAVGEWNYIVSEIGMALVNCDKLDPETAIRIIYAAYRFVYNDPDGAAGYEDESITNPEKGDIKGYLRYTELHPEKFKD